MRKITLLFLSLVLTSTSWAQVNFNILYEEDFDAPSGPDSVTNSVIPTTSSSAWNDTSFLSTSPNMSYHVKGQAANEIVLFETDAFSTIGNPYVLFSFNHIAKFFPTNRAYLEVSVDNGVTWDTLDGTSYRGNSPNFAQTEYFQEASHAVWSSGSVPTNNWWVTEEFDLTGIASDVTVTPFVGYANVKIRFKAVFTFGPPSGFSSGWYVDDLLVIGNNCEVSPPQVTFDYTPLSCYANKPQNGLEREFSNSYPVGVLAFDTASVFDTGIDKVEAVYQMLNNGVWSANDTIQMPRYTSGRNGEYRGFFNNIFPLDTVRYYVLAYDKGCPNITRTPSLVQGGYYTFWINEASPTKCGQPNCGLAPTIIDASNPWVEDFEGNEWAAGFGNGNSNTVYTHRGEFPTYPDGYWNISPDPSSSAWGWSVRSGPTGGNPYTGPLGDHTPGQAGMGNYIYLESSPSVAYNTSSRLVTPCIDLTKSPTCLGLEFYYHFFGEDISFIRVDIDTGSDGAAFWDKYARIDGPGFNNQTDPWRKAVISLEPFDNQIIRVRFTAFERSLNKDRDDMAIDDIRIFVPSANDFAAIEQPFPVNGLCTYSANQEIQFSFLNNGCVTATQVPLAFQVIYNGVAQPTIYRDTLKNTTLAFAEDTLNYSFNPTANFSAPGTYQVKAWVDYPGDLDNSNDTAMGELINVYVPITNFPYIEDFENGAVGSQVINNNDFKFDDGFIPAFKWTVGEELTPESNTGPYSGFYWQGKYLYAKANSTTSAGETYLRTVCVDIPSTMSNPTLDFLYHAYGSDIDKLVVEISEEDENIRTWSVINAGTVVPSQNNELDDWKLRRVDLSNWAGTSVKLRFTARRKAGGSQTNIAIDNITIYDLLSTDAGAFGLNDPNKIGTFDTTVVPKFEVMNYGSNTLNNFTLHLDVTPLCGPNQNVTTSYTQNFTSQGILPATSAQVVFNSVNWDWDAGEYNLKAYTVANGDTYAFNDTIDRNIIIGGDIHPIPFNDNFDACDYSRTGFFAGGPGLLQWELGTPSFGFSGAHTTPNAWVTNLDGRFRVGKTERLLVPLLNQFDTIWKAELRFYQNIAMGNTGGAIRAAGTIEYFTNGAYQTLGVINSNIGQNWWASPYATPSSGTSMFGTGVPAFAFSTGGRWIRSRYPLDEFNEFQNEFIMRFIFKSDPTLLPQSAGAGWAIDDFSIYVPPQNTVAPHTVKTVNPLPFPNIKQEFEIQILNTGGKPVDSFNVDVYVDGQQIGSTYTHTIKKQGSFFRSDTLRFFRPTDTIVRYSPIEKFVFPFEWPAATVTEGPHEVCVITSRPNGKADNFMFDDTLCVTIDVLDEVDLTSNSPDTGYCNDFERTDPTLFNWPATNSETFEPGPKFHSWRWGTPDTSQLPFAHSGNNVWMTAPNADYKAQDRSSLYTPIFIIDSGQAFEMNFWHWMQSEPLHDGGNVEFTEDGGLTWQHIGWSISNKPWYNTQFVSALDQIKPGWSGDTQGWVNSSITMRFKNSTKIIFRIRFGSDQDIEDKGWAIDDFCFFKTDSAEYDIGFEDMPLPAEEVIGLPVPNPASSQTEISTVFPEPTDVNIRVVNTVGQLIEERSSSLTEGIHSFRFDTDSWRSGVYFINLEYNGKLITRKLVIGR